MIFEVMIVILLVEEILKEHILGPSTQVVTFSKWFTWNPFSKNKNQS